MDYLYSPWRDRYTKKSHARSLSNLEAPSEECILCSYAKSPERDSENFVIARNPWCYTMLNLYPYNGGHLLITPYTHANSLSKLSSEERAALMEAINDATIKLSTLLTPDGFNIGLNMGGKAAGGSLPEHIHFHIVPRWLGDTNFLVPLTDTKVISEDLPKLFTELKKTW